MILKNSRFVIWISMDLYRKILRDYQNFKGFISRY